MLGLSFGPPMLISHNANRRGHRTRGRRHGKVYHMWLSDSRDFKFVNMIRKIHFVLSITISLQWPIFFIAECSSFEDLFTLSVHIHPLCVWTKDLKVFLTWLQNNSMNQCLFWISINICFHEFKISVSYTFI